MKRTIEAFLLRQFSDPMVARQLDIEKRCLVLHRLEYQGRTYPGIEDWVTIQHEGKTRQATRAMLGKPAEEVVAPGSIVRGWREKGLVQLLCNQTLESGPYDVFALENGARGYRPWPDTTDETPFSTKLPPNEFDPLWVPVRKLHMPWPKPSYWSDVFYLPWSQAQMMPLKSENGPSEMVIDLSGALEKQHQRMVSAAY